MEIAYSKVISNFSAVLCLSKHMAVNWVNKAPFYFKNSQRSVRYHAYKFFTVYLKQVAGFNTSSHALSATCALFVFINLLTKNDHTLKHIAITNCLFHVF